MAGGLLSYHGFRFGLNGFILFAALTHVLTIFLSPALSVQCYWGATLAAIVGYAVSLWRAQRSKLGLNLQSVQALMATVDAQYFLHTFAFYYMNVKNLMLLLPLTVYALYATLDAAKHALKPLRPALYAKFLEPLSVRAFAKVNEAMLYTALTEVMLGIFLLVSVFTIRGSLIHVVIQWNFLAQRYRTNPPTKMVFGQLQQRLDGVFFHPRCPIFLGNLWRSLVSFLARMAHT